MGIIDQLTVFVFGVKNKANSSQRVPNRPRPISAVFHLLRDNMQRIYIYKYTADPSKRTNKRALRHQI